MIETGNFTIIMANIESIKRYIDNGSGTEEQFIAFVTKVNETLGDFGLNIDEHTIAEGSS